MCHGFRTCLERLLSLSQEMNEAPSSSNGAVWSVPHHHILNLTLTMLLDKIGKALAFGDSYWQSGAIQLPCEEENNVEIHRCLCQQWSPWPLPRGKTWASTPSWVLWTQRWLFLLIRDIFMHPSTQEALEGCDPSTCLTMAISCDWNSWEVLTKQQCILLTQVCATVIWNNSS